VLKQLKQAHFLYMENKTFVLCVDLDGVVADYETAFKETVARENGLDIADMGAQLSWDFSLGNWGITDRDHYLALHTKAVVEDRMFATMPAIKGASDALWRLSDAGVWVRIVTHRLVIKHTHHVAVADTVTWLEQPRPDGRPLVPYRDICFIGTKSEVGGDCYIDDAPHNVVALRAAGNDCIVMDAAYNRDIDGARAMNWDDVEKIVFAKMDWINSNPFLG
jgi:5'-nucleotidase